MANIKLLSNYYSTKKFKVFIKQSVFHIAKKMKFSFYPALKGNIITNSSFDQR